MPGWTRCRNETIGAEVELPTDALVAYMARGWDPISESRTIEQADAERVAAENAAATIEPPTAPAARRNQSTTTTGTAGATKEN